MSMVVPVIMLGVMVWGIACQVDVWSTLVEGGAQGLQTAVRMVPSLVGLLCGVYMLRASGALELLEGLIAPVLGLVGIPPETVGLLVVRPISGSAALGLGAELIETYGPDSLVGRTAAVMLGGFFGLRAAAWRFAGRYADEAPVSVRQGCGSMFLFGGQPIIARRGAASARTVFPTSRRR